VSVAEADDLFVIGERTGYAGEVGILVGMLQNARAFLLSAVRELDVKKLDSRPRGVVNTIGAILAHLDAAENMFQRITFEGRRFDETESARYRPAFDFRESDRPRGRELASYLDALRETRGRTLAGMGARDEAWLREPRTFAGRPASTHYFWLHYLQDEARHTGQIILIRKHLIDGADPDFDPYAF
jgi:uncharacterized damage-inducible protein DinB